MDIVEEMVQLARQTRLLADENEKLQTENAKLKHELHIMSCEIGEAQRGFSG